MFGDEYYVVYNDRLDDNIILGLNSIPKGLARYAYFHKESDAKGWNKRMFGEKEEVTPDYFYKELGPDDNVMFAVSQENGTYNILISKEIKDKVVIKFE